MMAQSGSISTATGWRSAAPAHVGKAAEAGRGNALLKLAADREHSAVEDGLSFVHRGDSRMKQLGCPKNDPSNAPISNKETVDVDQLLFYEEGENGKEFGI